MADIYTEMAALGRELEAVDAKIFAALTGLRAERQSIQDKMARLAKAMTSGPEGELHLPDEAPLPKLAPRPLQLLGFLADGPRDLSYLAQRMFGEDNQTKRKGISAMFSEMKPHGLVKADGSGVFELTEAGARVVKAGNH